MLLAKASKWLGKAINKEEKLTKVLAELNNNVRHMKKLEEGRRKV